jgi:F0F1-type ATP synthase delta subunit
MKYPTHIYAKALVEVLADAEKAGAKDTVRNNEARFADNFLALVRKNSDEMHLRKILEEAARFARGKSGIRKVTLESARALSTAQRKEVAKFMKPDDVIEERIDPELIAGIRILLDDELQFDGSLKNKLEKAFGART